MSIATIPLNKKYDRIIQIELNEISEDIIRSLVKKGELPNFARILKDWSFFKTTSENDYEEIEPWIQWVTAHTGKFLDEHKIFRLGDAHKLEHEQVWEVLSKKGIESGVIGSMNAKRGETNGGIFFPDPWALQNETYPDELRPLWDLISSRVQQHATSDSSSSGMLSGLKSCLKLNLPLGLYTKIANQLVSQKLDAKNKWKLAGVFDVFLGDIFQSVLKSTNFGYYTLFLNAVAHYQHHYWRNFDSEGFDKSIKYTDIHEKDDPITYGYKVYDKILGKILKQVGQNDSTLILIASGLSQVPYVDKEEQGGMNYYRLNDHKAFANQIGLNGEFEIFPLMSRDWQLSYKSQESREKALSVLNSLSVANEPLFNVKENTEGFIFVETQYTKGVDANTDIILNGGEAVAKFDQTFTNIAIKSGHHTGIGNLWLSDKLHTMDREEVPLTALFDLAVDNFAK